MNASQQTAYLAPLGFEQLLLDEITNITTVGGRLVLAAGPPQPALWAQNIWYEPQVLTISSINDAANVLRAMQRNWWPYSYQLQGRMKLIQEKLPHLAPKPLQFLGALPSSPLGSWTLLDETHLLAAPRCSSPMPNGEWHFVEDKLNPPSRAYLKLWEFFTRFRMWPSRNEVCLDLGASPGGWTFVLAGLAKKVIAIDRSKLDERLLSTHRNIQFHAGDAFKVNLADYPEASWVFSDLVCYPDKLYDFIARLLKDFPDKKYVFTIKFQGDNHTNCAPLFTKLPGTIVHLSQNKHELTWFKL